jgi:uncharacterized protein YrrD
VAGKDAHIAWTAVGRGHPVHASDGEQVGKVARVVADQQKDIFAGITFRSHLFEIERFAPADIIEGITEASVQLAIPSPEAEALEAYEA